MQDAPRLPYALIEGKLTRLRAVEPGDLERDYFWMNDPEIQRTLQNRYPLSTAEQRRWVEGTSASGPDDFLFAIETRDGIHIGNIGLHRLDQVARIAELGIMVGEREYLGRGYGTDAIIALLRWGFRELNLHRVWLRVYDFNERGRRSYLKVGFREEGRLRQHHYAQGEHHDAILMGILRGEFEAAHGER